MSKLQSQFKLQSLHCLQSYEIPNEVERMNENFQKLIYRLKGEDQENTGQAERKKSAQLLSRNLGYSRAEKKLDFCFQLKHQIKFIHKLKFSIIVKEQLSLYPHLRQTTFFFTKQNFLNIGNFPKSKRLMLLQYINKLNSQAKAGNFCFNILTGSLHFKYSHKFTTSFFVEAVRTNNFMTNVGQEAERCLGNIKQQLKKIFRFCDILPDTALDSQSVRNLRKYVFRTNRNQISSEYRQEIKGFYQSMVSRKENVSRLGSAVYSRIEVPELCNWRNFCQTSFSKLYATQTRIKLLNFPDEQQRKPEYTTNLTMVKKVALERAQILSLHDSKIAYEKHILSSLKNVSWPGLLRFFTSYQQSYNGCLMMEYMSNKSLESYSHHNKNIMTLQTKLYLLSQIVQALIFLNSQKIVHLDIKPANILISRFLRTKITDFGQSFRIDYSPKNHLPAFTYPYASPEIFQSKVSFCTKLDVFSFGVLMMELLFSRYPLQFRDQSIHKYTNSLEKNTYWEKIFINYEHLLNYMKPEISQILIELIIQCLQPQKSLRCTFDQIRIVLKECQKLLTKFY